MCAYTYQQREGQKKLNTKSKYSKFCCWLLQFCVWVSCLFPKETARKSFSQWRKSVKKRLWAWKTSSCSEKQVSGRSPPHTAQKWPEPASRDTWGPRAGQPGRGPVRSERPWAADRGRRGQVGTPEKPQQQHRKGRLEGYAGLPREGSLQSTMQGLHGGRERGLAAGETGRTQVCRSHSGPRKETPSMTHWLLTWVRVAAGGKDEERKTKPWETGLVQIFTQWVWISYGQWPSNITQLIYLKARVQSQFKWTQAYGLLMCPVSP